MSTDKFKKAKRLQNNIDTKSHHANLKLVSGTHLIVRTILTVVTMNYHSIGSGRSAQMDISEASTN